MTNNLSIAVQAFGSNVLISIFCRWYAASEKSELVHKFQRTTIYSGEVSSFIKTLVLRFVYGHIGAYAPCCPFKTMQQGWARVGEFEVMSSA